MYRGGCWSPFTAPKIGGLPHGLTDPHPPFSGTAARFLAPPAYLRRFFLPSSVGVPERETGFLADLGRAAAVEEEAASSVSSAARRCDSTVGRVFCLPVTGVLHFHTVYKVPYLSSSFLALHPVYSNTVHVI